MIVLCFLAADVRLHVGERRAHAPRRVGEEDDVGLRRNRRRGQRHVVERLVERDAGDVRRRRLLERAVEDVTGRRVLDLDLSGAAERIDREREDAACVDVPAAAGDVQRRLLRDAEPLRHGGRARDLDELDVASGADAARRNIG